MALEQVVTPGDQGLLLLTSRSWFHIALVKSKKPKREIRLGELYTYTHFPKHARVEPLEEVPSAPPMTNKRELQFVDCRSEHVYAAEASQGCGVRPINEADVWSLLEVLRKGRVYSVGSCVGEYIDEPSQAQRWKSSQANSQRNNRMVEEMAKIAEDNCRIREENAKVKDDLSAMMAKQEEMANVLLAFKHETDQSKTPTFTDSQTQPPDSLEH